MIEYVKQNVREDDVFCQIDQEYHITVHCLSSNGFF